MNLYLEPKSDKINLVILPCAHELPFVSNTGNCDSSMNIKVNISQLGSDENKMSCYNLEKYSDIKSECVRIYSTTLDGILLLINIDWSIYSIFYDKSYRGDITKKYFSSKKQCRTTSMIEESIKYILRDNKIINGGRKKEIAQIN